MGRKFHKEVGHVVEGYRLPGLNRIVPANYELVSHRYNTGPLTWPACFVFYRWLRHLNSRPARLLTRLVYYPVRFLEG